MAAGKGAGVAQRRVQHPLLVEAAANAGFEAIARLVVVGRPLVVARVQRVAFHRGPQMQAQAGDEFIAQLAVGQ